MPDRGQSQALNFALPENRYIQTAPPVAPPQQEAASPLPQMGNDDFAQIEGLTDKFYNLKGQVEKYAIEAQKKYGVDVTQPDFTQPGGGILFKTYQKLATDLMLTANTLSNSFKETTADNAASRAGQIIMQEDFDPTKQASSTVAAKDRFFSTKLLDEVTALNRILDTPVYTQPDFNRMAAERDRVIDLINKRTDISEAQKQHNINAIVQMPQTTNPYALRPPKEPTVAEQAAADKEAAIVDLYKRVNNQLRGAYDPENSEILYDPITRKPMVVSGELGGTPLGKKAFVVKGQKKEYPLIVDKIITTSDGKTFVSFVQPEEAVADDFVIPNEDITGTKTDLFIKRMIQGDSRLGLKATELIAALKKANLYGDTGSKDSEAVNKELKIDLKKQEQNLKAAEKELLSKLSGTFKSGTTIPIETNSAGQNISVTSTTKGIFNKETVFSVIVDGVVAARGLDPEGVVNWVAENGEYFQNALNLPSEEEVPVETSQNNLVGVTPDLPPLPNETQAAYDLRKIRAKRN